MSALARASHLNNAGVEPPGGSAISPLSPRSRLDDWDTPDPSPLSSPAPEKCHELPDYVPPRNHQRSKDSTWNQSSYPSQAPPLPRPKPTRLATPNSGYPFPWVLSRQNTSEEGLPQAESSSSRTTTAETTSSPPTSDGTSSTFSSTTSEQDGPSGSFSDSSSSSSNCSTPKDGSPLPSPTSKSAVTTPFEVSQARTKNASHTPGAPPPMGFVGPGHARSFIDYRDVKDQTEVEQEEEVREDDETTPKKPINPLVSSLQRMSVGNKGGKVD